MTVNVSVIIPSYNREMLLKRAVISVLNQSYQDFEIIIVDDGSNDNTKAVVESFHHPKIFSISHETNRGAAAARNTGIANAKGSYVAFLDSDDEWDKDKLAIQLTLMMEENDLEMNASCTGFFLHLLDDNKTITNDLSQHKSTPDFILKGCDLSPGSTLIVKKIVFETIGVFDERLQRLEDWDWLLRYYRFQGNIALIHQPLSIIYNKRGRNGKALKQSIPIFIQNNLSFFNELNFFRKRQVLADVWLQAVGTFRREKTYYEAFLSLLIAVKYDPFVIVRYCLNKKNA